MLVPRVLTRHGAQTARYRSSFANIVNRIRRKKRYNPGIEARLSSTAWFPLTPRTRLCGDMATTSKTRGHGWLAFGVFYSGDDESDICAVGETWC